MYSNLISESVLVSDTVSLLRSHNGKASAVNIVDLVMKIRRPERTIARELVKELVEHDPRLQLNGDTVELIDTEYGSRGLDDAEFVVFDLETTGAQAPPDRITEIGAFRVKNGEVTEDFHTLVNPGQPIPRFITELTGINDDMVAEAPHFADIAGEFLQFIGDSVLVAHNSGFDMRFLDHEIGLVFPEHRVANPCLCTVQLSRRLLPHIANHKLKTVAEHYSIDLVDHHRAKADAYATAHIFVNLLMKIRDEGVNDISGLRQFSSRNNKYAKRLYA
ncbi:MAG: exonuclease domain-containing protein [Pyrinomonadaceae bacterium]|nr:exonuclease domain-containing protein [Pyrinomonadaceae bacterium]